MLCSNCGKDIPFNGNVCPWCKKNKAGDQVAQVIGVLGVFVAAALAYGLCSATDAGLGAGLVIWIVVLIPFVIWANKARREADAKASAAGLQAKTAEAAHIQSNLPARPVQIVDADTRECPFCAETIMKKATVCRFCNRTLSA